MKKMSFIFPGQGSQSAGMLNKYLEHSEQYKKIVTRYCEEASSHLGYDTLDLITNDSEGKLNQTIYTQPLLLLTSFIYWQIWLENGGKKPDFMAGHSLGEYSALLCSGALSFVDALKLVQTRAQLMQAAVPEGVGAMGVVLGLSAEQVNDICKQHHSETSVVEAVNINSPLQIVVSGHSNAVNLVLKQASETGAKLTKLLPITVPSHSTLMRKITSEFSLVLDKTAVKEPAIPVVNNAEVQVHSDPQLIKNALVKQLHLTVDWVKTIQLLEKLGVDTCVECGPGKVLLGLTKRIDRGLTLHSLDNPDYMVSAVYN